MPVEYRIYDRLELLLWRFDIVRVQLAIFYAIFGRSIYAKEESVVASFESAYAEHKLSIRDSWPPDQIYDKTAYGGRALSWIELS